MIMIAKSGERTRGLRFEPSERVTAVGLTVDRVNYDLVCAALDLFPGLEKWRQLL